MRGHVRLGERPVARPPFGVRSAAAVGAQKWLTALGTSPRRANVCRRWGRSLSFPRRESVVSAAADAGELVRADVDRRERAWVRDAQRGSAAALEQLFRSHWPRAYRAALLVVGDTAAAEDIAQESFLAAVRALDRFDRRRPFGPWLHRIVVNRAIDWSRARTLRRELAVDAVAEPAAAEREPGGRADELATALAELGAEHRAVIVLRYLLDYTPGEIAELLDLPRGTVNSRLRRGLDRLEEELRQ
jgi:RNA polymerase sigma-70 factor, ECF subfamily